MPFCCTENEGEPRKWTRCSRARCLVRAVSSFRKGPSPTTMLENATPSLIVRLFTEEPAEGAHKAVRALDVGQVTAGRYKREGALSEAGGGLSCLGYGEYPIGDSPDNERRHLQTREPVQ